MSDQLSALRLFVRVAATGSFSQAAREQNLTQPTASRIIATLEEQLGNTLFVRTTRAVTLTEMGSEYLGRIKPVLEALDEADHAVRGDGELRGSLRVGVSSIVASRLLVPHLSDFQEKHRHLRIELVVDDKRQDLISENVDVVLRFGKLADSSALAKRVGRWPLVVAAAPSYLAKRGSPILPSDLAAHIFVAAGPASGKEITFRRDGREISVLINGRLAITGAEVAVNAGIAGLGIVIGSFPSFQREFERGELVRLLPDWDIGDITAHALFPSGQTPKPAARAFVDFVVEKLGTAAVAPTPGN